MDAETNQMTIINVNRDKDLFESIQIVCGLYLMPIVCIPGLICNILCIIVFTTDSMQRFLTTQFLLFLAISDALKLSNDLLYSTVLIIKVLNQEFGKKLFLILYRYCHYINTVSTLCTAWLTLIVAIERFVLCNAHSQKRLAIQRNSRTTCYSVIFCSLLLSLPISFRYENTSLSTIVDENLRNSTSTLRLTHFGGSRLFRVYSIIIDLVRAIIPSLLLFYLNAHIVYLLCRTKSSTSTAFYRLTISLIIIIGCFICCYFPDALLSLILNMGYIEESYRKRAIREITDFFVTFNSAINFPIYFCTSYTFQRSVLRLFRRKSKSYASTAYNDVIRRQEQRQPLNNRRYLI